MARIFKVGDHAAITFTRKFFDLKTNKSRDFPPGTIVEIIEENNRWREPMENGQEVEMQDVTIQAGRWVTQTVLGLRPLNTLERMVVEGR